MAAVKTSLSDSQILKLNTSSSSAQMVRLSNWSQTLSLWFALCSITLDSWSTICSTKSQVISVHSVIWWGLCIHSNFLAWIEMVIFRRCPSTKPNCLSVAFQKHSLEGQTQCSSQSRIQSLRARMQTARMHQPAKSVHQTIQRHNRSSILPRAKKKRLRMLICSKVT